MTVLFIYLVESTECVSRFSCAQKGGVIDVRNETAPSIILNLFTSTSKIHTYNYTRFSTSNKFHIKKSRLEIQQKAVSRIGAKVWNELPAALTKLTKKTIPKDASHCTN